MSSITPAAPPAAALTVRAVAVEVSSPLPAAGPAAAAAAPAKAAAAAAAGISTAAAAVGGALSLAAVAVLAALLAVYVRGPAAANTTTVGSAVRTFHVAVVSRARSRAIACNRARPC